MLERLTDEKDFAAKSIGAQFQDTVFCLAGDVFSSARDEGIQALRRIIMWTGGGVAPRAPVDGFGLPAPVPLFIAGSSVLGNRTRQPEEVAFLPAHLASNAQADRSFSGSAAS